MENQEKSPDVHYTADLFRPEDAQGVVELFKAVYGDRYPIRIFYDPERLAEANRTGEYYSIVARTRDGRILGVHNIFRSAPYESLYEWGAGLVLKECRGLGISGRIVRHLLDVVVPMLRIDEMYGEAVCNHLHLQKVCVQEGFIETALEVALMPEAAYTLEKTASGRVATVLGFRCYKPKPHTVFLPAVYEDELRFLYAALDDERTLVRADEDLPVGVSSASQTTIFDFAQVARIAVHTAGADLESHFARLESDACYQNVVVLQAWLKLNSPAVGSAVETLRKRGYFLGGILPRWFNEDGILMQRIRCSPDLEAIQLHSDRAREILEIVKRDWDRSSVTSTFRPPRCCETPS
jgi:GNAT superfamily N-acetyltransferase